MKKVSLICALLILILSVSSCGKQNFNIDGNYKTDRAYGKADYTSELKVDGNKLDYSIRSADKTVEEDKGKFTFKDNTIKFKGKKATLVFSYDPKAKTIRSDKISTTWTIESLFVPTKTTDNNTAKSDNGKSAVGTEPDPNPASVMGTYVYSDDKINAKLVITEHEYKLTATATAGNQKPFEASGQAVYMGTNIGIIEDGNPVQCPYDEKAGTISYSGYVFKKQ